MSKVPPKEEPRTDAKARKGDESSKAQPVENKVSLEELLDFSFAEVVVERRVALNVRTNLACS